ncbi:MAG: hypothetical protein AAF757_18670 [Cyanobacteria bacterium P01_D01_bin.116]
MSRFVLIPESDYKKQNPIKSLTEKIIFDPNVTEKSKLFSVIPKQTFANRLENPTSSNSDQTTQIGNDQYNRILSEVTARKKQCQTILDRITDNPNVDIAENDDIIIYGAPSGIKIGTFLHKLQLIKTSFNDLESDVFVHLIKLLDLTDNLVRNKYILNKTFNIPVQQDIPLSTFTPSIQRTPVSTNLIQSAPELQWESIWDSEPSDDENEDSS